MIVTRVAPMLATAGPLGFRVAVLYGLGDSTIVTVLGAISVWRGRVLPKRYSIVVGALFGLSSTGVPDSDLRALPELQE